MAEGIKVVRDDGTPQGGPLSPFLANVYLDEVDKELERRGHAFVRYADDLRVLVYSRRAGERVMRALVKRFEKLKLRVNESKSTVARVYERPFLSFQLREGKDGPRIRVASKALKVMRERVRELTRRTRGRKVKQVAAELGRYLRGWWNYFGFTEEPWQLRGEMGWVRRRMRCYILYQYKTPKRAYEQLRVLGATKKQARKVAAHLRHHWCISTGTVNRIIKNSHLVALGIPTLVT